MNTCQLLYPELFLFQQFIIVGRWQFSDSRPCLFSIDLVISCSSYCFKRFFFLNVSVCVSIWVCVCIHAHECGCPQGPEKGSTFSGSGLSGSCELLDWNDTQDLWQSSKSSEIPSHRSSFSSSFYLWQLILQIMFFPRIFCHSS